MGLPLFAAGLFAGTGLGTRVRLRCPRPFQRLWITLSIGIIRLSAHAELHVAAQAVAVAVVVPQLCKLQRALALVVLVGEGDTFVSRFACVGILDGSYGFDGRSLPIQGNLVFDGGHDGGKGHAVDSLL